MVVRRRCVALGPEGHPCRAAPLRDSEYCRMHSPELAKEVQEARRLGGLRHKRESTISAAFLFESLTSVPDIRRLLQIAATDTLALDNTIARNRALAYYVQVALNALEKGDMEQRIVELEQVVLSRRSQHSVSSSNTETNLLESGKEEEK